MYEELYMKQCIGIHKVPVPTSAMDKFSYDLTLANCLTMNKVIHRLCPESFYKMLEKNKKK
jgi:hypothetical protein